MYWFAWLDTLNLIDVFNYYLILAFLVSTGIRLGTYRAVLGLVFACPNRWPKLLQLVRKYRTLFLGWPTLLIIGVAFSLMLSNALASRLVWVQASVSFQELWGHWLAFMCVFLLGGMMLVLDCRGIFIARRFDRTAVEVDLDKAESWLKSWVAPTLRLVTFGFVNPRKIVGAEVQRLLAEANWKMVGGMGRSSLRIGMQMAFGLALWLTWLLALREAA